MKPWPSSVLLALLLVPWAWGPAAGRQAPGMILKSCCNAVTGAHGSFQEYQKAKSGSDFPWVFAYRPIRSCHRVLKDKYGEFSPPAYCGDSPTNFWCDWTIWAGFRKHIIIYIQGFITEEDCNINEDKILFEGVSSLVENSVVYACWKKETHVFATFAQAVHVVLLKRYLPDCRERQFKGKYYMFQDQKDESSSKVDVISQTPAPKLPKQDSIFQSRWTEEFRDVWDFVTTHSTVSLGKTPGLTGGLLQGRGSMLDTTAVGSPVELVTYEGARTLLMETKTPCIWQSELQGGTRYFKEAQGSGTLWGIIPTADQDFGADPHCSQSLSVSGDITMGFGYMHGLSSVLLETPLLDALQVAEPFLQQADVGLEDRQAVLHPTLRPRHLGDLQFTIKPTSTSCLDLTALSQTLLPGRRESTESRDTTMCIELSPVSFEKDQSHSQSSVLADVTVSSHADGLAKGLISSLSSLYEVVDGDHSQLLPETSQGWQSSFGDLSMTQHELGTTGLQHTKLMDISSLEHFRGAFERKTMIWQDATLDIFQEHPHLRVQSSHVLHSDPTDPGSLSQNAQGYDRPATEEARVLSLGVKSCHHHSGRAAQPGLVVPTSPTGLEHAPTAKSTKTENIHVPVVSCTEPVPADFSSTDFTSQAPLPPEVKPVSPIVFSSALDLDHVSLWQRAGVSLTSPGEQEMVSPSPSHHLPATSEPGIDESPGCLGPGMQKLALEEAGGQRAETSAPVGLAARSPSPASVTSSNLGVGLPWPEDYASSGSGVAPAPRPGIWGPRREEHMVPLQHQGTVASYELVSASILEEFKVQKTTEALRAGAGQQRNASFSVTSTHPGPSVAHRIEMVSRGQKSQEPSDDPLSRNIRMPGGQQWKHAELGLPWAVEYFPIRSCHVIFHDGYGIFYLPLHMDVETNIWCNWTILAGSQKHIVIYIQGFQGNNGCGKNQDKIIFQGVLSSVETKVVYACHNRGTLIFATKATAVHVLFLSGSGYLSHEYTHFKGWYYVFKDSEIVGSSNDNVSPQKSVQEVSKKESCRMEVTKGLLPMLRASLSSSGAPASGRIQTELASPDDKPQQSPHLVEGAQSGANLSKLDLNECGQLWDVPELERSLKDDSAEDRETKDNVLMELSPAGQDTGHKAELFASEIAKGDVELVPPLVSVALCCSAGVPYSEVPSSNTRASAKSSSLDQASDSLSGEMVTAAHCVQTPVLEDPPLNTSITPFPLYPSPGMTAGHVVSPGIRNEEFFDLVSALASSENDTALQSQHHPGDVLFEVTIEVKLKDWIPRGGCELKKGLLESMKNNIQENLKLSANRVNEIKLKEIKRTSDANLLLTFWLHLKPEERNMSLLLHSQLEELLGTSVGVKKPQLVSLFVEDVNECSAGVGLCGEEAECFNSVGTYLCRCKKDYEDHSPTKSGTLCIRAPRSGIGFFLRHADILVGAAVTAGLVMLVAAGALCRASRRRQYTRRSLSPEDPPVRAAEEPAMELHDLGECLRLDPFQLKLRARPPEWLWGARTYPGQAYQVFLEQSPQP